MMNGLAAAFAAVTLAASPVLVATPVHAKTPSCGVTWGSLPEARNPGSTGVVTDVRTGRHACFDRLVLDVTGGGTTVSSYSVRYVGAVTSDGSGAVVPLRGGAFLQITVGADDQEYRPANRRELANVAGYTTFRQVAWAGGFEGYSSVGLGTRARLPFRVLTLAGPGNAVRVVIDVAHRW
jgi:hypothetical protein